MNSESSEAKDECIVRRRKQVKESVEDEEDERDV